MKDDSCSHSGRYLAARFVHRRDHSDAVVVPIGVILESKRVHSRLNMDFVSDLEDGFETYTFLADVSLDKRLGTFST